MKIVGFFLLIVAISVVFFKMTNAEEPQKKQKVVPERVRPLTAKLLERPQKEKQPVRVVLSGFKSAWGEPK